MQYAARIRLDITEAERQLAEFSALLEHLPKTRLEQILGDFDDAFLDVVLGDCVTATAADGAIEVLYPARLGLAFESFVSALRAGEVDILSHGGSLVG